jgi:hypothetical protein
LQLSGCSYNRFSEKETGGFGYLRAVRIGGPTFSDPILKYYVFYDIFYSTVQEQPFWKSDSWTSSAKPIVKSKTKQIRVTDICIEILINDSIRIFCPDSLGYVFIDLVKDFSLRRFTKPAKILVKSEDKESTIKNGTMLDMANILIDTIDSNDWTFPSIIINKNRIQVETEENGKLLSVGEAKKGEVYRVLYEGQDLIKIDYKSREGYVPKNSGEIFWATKIYYQN